MGRSGYGQTDGGNWWIDLGDELAVGWLYRSDHLNKTAWEWRWLATGWMDCTTLSVKWWVMLRRFWCSWRCKSR